MDISENQEQIIDLYLDEDHLMNMVGDTSRIAWQRVIEEDDINQWLNNFTGECLGNEKRERKIALWLLAHFTYYTLDDIRILCQENFNQFIHLKLTEINDKELDIKSSIEDILRNTLFIGLGNNSESGNNILYYFRQENNLPKDNFLIEDKKYQNIVYIDDVTISGTQAARYINSSNIDSEHRYFASLIASEEAIKYINGKNIVEKVIYSTCLDERERAFAEESHMFADKNICDIKNIIKTFCQFYGEKVNKKSPLGYKDGQYMIGLVHNTPNNTLPIFWETHNGWQPIFKRYPKIISGKEREFDGDKYY